MDQIEHWNLLEIFYQKGQSRLSDKEILLPLIQGEEITLSNNYYLAFGDNTTNSSDSRYWGFVKDERILGTLLLRYWPLNKLKVMVNQ